MADFQNRSVIPFRGRLLKTIRKRYAEIPVTKKVKVKGEEVEKKVWIEYVDGKGKKRRKMKKVKAREIGYIFTVYSDLVALDDYALALVEKYGRDAKGYEISVESNLAELYRKGFNFFMRRFGRDRITPEMRNNYTQGMIRLKELDTTIKNLMGFDTDLALKFQTIREIAGKPKTRKTVGFIQSMVEDLFGLMNVPVESSRRTNPSLGLKYLQFKMGKKLEKQVAGSETEADLADLHTRMLNAQEKALELQLMDEGLVVSRRPVYAEGQKATMVVAYDPAINKLTPVKKPRSPNLQGLSEAAKETALQAYEAREDVKAYRAYMDARRGLVKAVYSSQFLSGDEKSRSFQSFDSVEAFNEAYQKKVRDERHRMDVFPEVTETKAGIQEITFKGATTSFELKPFVAPYPFISDNEAPRDAFISDGENTRGIRRAVKVRQIMVGGEIKDLIMTGRFKGFLLEDIINAAGKLIEGSTHTMVNGKKVEREIVDADGNVSFMANESLSILSEPYITLTGKGDERGLCIGIPSANSNTEDRKTMKRLSDQIASIKPKFQFPIPAALLNKAPKDLSKEQKAKRRKLLTQNSRYPFYTFEASDYEIIRDALGSVCLSKSASDYLDRYYRDLTKRDRALNEENLKRFRSENLGGFKTHINDRPFQFNNKQREAMAWLEANDFSGVMALDTGVGKTLLSVGAMKMAISEEGGSSRRFLFISPDRLVGNGRKEIMLFADSDVAPKLSQALDEISYKDFVKLFEENGSGYFSRKYYAVFFDEVNEALRGKKFKALSTLKHKRKVLLTASAIEKDPVDLYRFVTLAQGDNYDRKKERKWAERYCSVVGGRRIGLTSDPLLRAEFNKWVKANAYFAFKGDVDLEEVGQPKLHKPETKVVSVPMSRKLTRIYREKAKELQVELEGMLKKYRDEVMDEEAYSSEVTVVRRGKRKKAIKTLKDLAQRAVGKQLRELIAITSDPSKFVEGDTSKVDASAGIYAEDRTARIVYFTSQNKVARSVAENNALRFPDKIHAALLSSSIIFYQAGSKGKARVIARANKKSAPSFDSRFEDILLQKRAAEEAEWAVRIAKKYLRDNPNIGTIACTDAYAKGFNFQTFNKVVHLDRGKGFDSELIKQRTARAYRTGQTEVVEEIFLDSTMAPAGESDTRSVEDVSIQEIQKMVAAKDQEFFMDIIRTGMETSLTESVDAVERVVGTDIKNPPTADYLSLLLNPTPEGVAAFEAEEAKRESSPIDFISLDPERRSRIEDAFSRSGVLTQVDKEQLDRLDAAGLSTLIDSSVPIQTITSRQNSYNDDVMVGVTTETFKSERVINKQRRAISNEVFTTTPCAPKQLGTRMVTTQIVNAIKSGDFDSIELYAAGGGSYNGALIWPKFGYDGNISVDQGDFPEGDFRDGMAFSHMGVEGSRFFNLKISDILAYVDSSGKPVGWEWWSKNYKGFNAAFDLQEGSRSRRIMNEYLKRKSGELNLTPEQYLSSPLPPFNVESPACWRLALLNWGLPEETILSFREEFKRAYYSSEQVQEAVRSSYPELIKKLDLFKTNQGELPALSGDRTQRRASSDGDLPAEDNAILKSIWTQIGREKSLRALKADILEDSDNQDLLTIQDL